MCAYFVSAVAAAAILPTALGSHLTARSNSTMVYDFSKLTPSADLKWTPCYDNFTCALLEVPLDYSNASIGTVNLAVIKKPGESEDAQEVLLNPGGPGGSSVAAVRVDYEAVQNKIGKQYALIGIDPRGVSNSGPSSDCFPGYSHVARNAFFADIFSPADISSDYALRLNHQSMRAYGDWCSNIYAVNGTARYASTVATAQDMLHYIELRAKDLNQKPEEAKLWYYGMSYGSVLGATFASLYPDRIGRMIIDGVMDLEDHYNGGWEKSIVDTDEAARFFFKRCFEAGPKLCLFHQNATSWQELEKRYWNIMHVLKENPIGIGNPNALPDQNTTVITPTVLTYQDIINLMFVTAYVLSAESFITMDYALTGLQNGVNDLLSAISLKAQISTTTPRYDKRMAQTLVNCLDSNHRSNYTKFEDYEKFINTLCDTSIYGCLNIAYFSGPICDYLDVTPPESQAFDGIPKVPSTSAPILFVSSMYDPITPLPAARKMQSLFPGSGLLVFNSSGHCAHFQESACISQYEKQYMIDGTLPPSNTICEIDQPNPFVIYANLTAGSA